MGSSLRKDLYKQETRIPKGEEWARELINEIPRALLPVVTQFLMEGAPGEGAKRAQMLHEIMQRFDHGLLGAENQLQLLGYCIDQAKERLENEKEKPN